MRHDPFQALPHRWSARSGWLPAIAAAAIVIAAIPIARAEPNDEDLAAYVRDTLDCPGPDTGSAVSGSWAFDEQSRVYQFTCRGSGEASEVGFLLVTGETIEPIPLEMPVYASDGFTGGCVLKELVVTPVSPGLRYDEESKAIVMDSEGTTFSGEPLPALRWSHNSIHFTLDSKVIDAILVDRQCP